METNLLKYMAFIKTVELGSFTKASEYMNYSQSGISRMINDLENEWGIKLLERSRTGIALTSEGSQLLPCVRSLCNEYDRLNQQVKSLGSLHSGIIRIGTFSSVATHWLPDIIKAFRRDYPGIDFEFALGDYRETEERISDGRIDCGFLCSYESSDIKAVPLQKDSFMAVLPEKHPLAQSEKVPLEAMCTEPFMLIEQNGSSEVIQIFEKYGMKPQIHFRTWDDYAIMSMVESELGISILPQLILRRIPYRIAVKPLEADAYRTIFFATKKNSVLSAAARKFTEYLKYRNSL